MQAGAERAVAALAASQHGAIGIRQAAEKGMSEKERRVRVARGQWLVVADGVMVVAGAPKTWRQQLMIAVLRTGGVASHRAAAALHGFDGFPEREIEVSVERQRRVRSIDFRVHRVTQLENGDVTVVDGIPTTNIARTLCDLGRVACDDLVEQALDDALRSGCSQRWIEETLARLDRPGPSGTASLRRVLARPDRAGRLPDSVFERLIQRVIVAGDLPRPVRQHPVHDEEGRLMARIDLAWPDIRVGVEATSEHWHTGPRRGRRDAVRHSKLTGRGWAMFYPGWNDAKEPGPFIADVLRVHRERRTGSSTAL